MKNYDQYRKEAGYYDINLMFKYKYYAYNQGQITIYNTYEEAQNVSHTVEKVCVNREEIAEKYEAYKTADEQALRMYTEDLRDKYSHLSTNLFNLCYSEACDRKFSKGYDEIAAELQLVINFTEKILACKK